MIPATFGVIQVALDALDAQLDDVALAALPAEDLAEAWRAASGICRTADDIYNRLRAALTNEFIRTGNRKVP